MTFSFEIMIIVAFIFFLAAFIHGSIGFGFPMVATPLLTLVSDIQTAIILTIIPTFMVNIVTIASEGDMWLALRRYLPLAILAMIGSAIGTLILIVTKSDIFEALLAVAIIVYLLSEKINIKLSWVKEYPNFSRSFFGISAGILGGLTNVMAPILIIYSIESNYSKKEIIQAANLCFLFGKLIQLFMFSIYGKFNASELSTSILMIFVVAFALYIGIHIKEKIVGAVYTKTLRTFLFLLSITLFIRVIT